MGLLDRFIGNLTRGQSQGPYALNEDDRKALGRQGLLQAGLQMLATPSNGSQGIARGLLAGVQGIQGGADALVNDRYRTDVMQRTRDQMAANTARETAARGVLNPDGTLNVEGWQRYAELDPLQAIQLRAQIEEANAPKPLTPNPRFTREEGAYTITEEFDPKTGQWRELGRAPRWQPNTGGGGRAPTALEQKIATARSLGASDEQIRAMVLGTSASQAGAGAAAGAQAAGPDPMAGFNDRQKAGAAVLQSNVLNYAAAITGRPVSELRLLPPDEIAALMRAAPERPIEGGTARAVAQVPLIGDLLVNIANSDVGSWSKGAASGLANVANPAGTVGEGDMRSADAQVMNPLDPRDVQATKVEAFLRQTGFRPQGGASTSSAAPPPAAPTGIPAPGEIRNGYRFKGGNPADRNSWEKV